MSTTATDQGVRCGNHGKGRVYHADRNAVRACFAGRTAPAAAPSQPRTAEDSRNDAIQRLANQTSPFFANRRTEYPASEKQINFLRDLITETTAPGEGRDAMLAKVERTSSKDAKEWIGMLIRVRGGQRKQEEANPKAVPARNGAATRTSLIDKVMGAGTEANYCIIDGDGKARFYRISKRGKRSRRPGTWKIQERVTDMLLPRADSMLAKVCQAIIDQGGAEAAGLRWAELMHRCYKCGASLTDTTGNPYYSVGLGPECGSK